MNPARFTVARPVFTVMVTLIALTLGGIALNRLPIDLMPDITYPTLTITAEYGNVGPEEMELLVTRPLEEALVAVPGVEEISSESGEGNTNIRVSFTWGTNLDVATNDIRDRMDRVIDELPEDMERPQIRKFDIASFPILLVGISSRLDPVKQRQLVDEQISYRLERIPGVAAVDIWGGLEREIHINLKEEKIEALGLSLDAVRTAIQDANVVVPAGQIERGKFDVSLRTPAEFSDLDQLRDLVIATQNGVAVYLHQVADVVDSHVKLNRIIRINDNPGIRLAVSKQSGSNTVQVATAVKQEMERLKQDYPQLNIVPVMDTSEYIKRAINNVSRSILYGGSLAVLVLLFFLRDIRSTLVIATAIPISIISTFVLIYFGGLTLNLMTLGGLALGVGMMVDNAIVVIENITRLRRDEGYSPTQAAVEGSGQVSAAVVASTLTTLVIFLPMVFAQDMAGILFRQLGYVIGFALLCSLVVSLTLIPMLVARLVRSHSNDVRPESVNRLEAACSALYARVESGYLWLLDAALKARWQSLLLTVLLLLVSLTLLPHIGGAFMPETDEAEVRVEVQMQPGTRLDVLNERALLVESIIKKHVPEMQSIVANVGGSSYRGRPSEAEIEMSLVPGSQRDRSSQEIAADLRRQLAGIAGVTIRARAGQGLFIFHRVAGGESEKLEIEIRGYNLETLDRLGKVIRDVVQPIEGITDVRLSREQQELQTIFRINRERAADLNVSVEQIARTIETAIAGRSAGQFRRSGNEFNILVKLDNAEQKTLDDILNLTLMNKDSDQVVLRNVISTESSERPVEIDRKDQQRVVDVDANVSGRDLNSVVADVRTELQKIPTPDDTEIIIAGEYEEQQKAFAELLLNFVLAVILVYMVIACLYESLIDPLIVMMCVPLALIGVLLALFFTGTTFNVQSFIGCVMLVGIVVNNAILIVDHAGRLHREGNRDVFEVVRLAGRHRLRPVLMTSLTTILALIPLAIGIGEGSETQAPLARVVIGGMLSATLITLVVIPVLYSLIHRKQRRALGDLGRIGVSS